MKMQYRLLCVLFIVSLTFFDKLSLQAQNTPQDELAGLSSGSEEAVETGSGGGAPENEVARVVDAEDLSRREKEIVFRQKVDNARRLSAAGEFGAARSRLQEVLSDSSDLGPDNLVVRDARLELANVASRQAMIAEKEKEWERAAALWSEASSLLPDRKDFRERLAAARAKANSLQAEFPGNVAVTEELVGNVARIEQLLKEGDSFFETGQFGRARVRYEEILTIDPYNRVAWKRIDRLNAHQHRANSIHLRFEKEEALNKVAKAWQPTIVPFTEEKELLVAEDAGPSQVALINRKLESIIIPEINFTRAEVESALRFLEAQSVELDVAAEGGVRGVNFVVKLPREQDGTPTPLQPITLQLKDVPLGDALTFIATLANLRIEVEEHAVFILPSNDTTQVFDIRSFYVDPTFVPSAGGGGAAKVDVAADLVGKGIPFPNGATAFYLPRTSKLVVRNTPDNLNRIEQLVRQSDQTAQILVEVKFIEFNQDKLDALAFRTRLSASADIPKIFPASTLFGGGTFFDPLRTFAGIQGSPGDTNFSAGSDGLRGGRVGANLPGIQGIENDSIDALLLGSGQARRTPARIGFNAVLDGKGVSFFIDALASTVGGDVLSAPSVLLRDGDNRKTIRIVRRFFYPQSYEAPTINNDDESSIVPPNPQDFTSRDVGVVLIVSGRATPDRRINLHLQPQVVDFEGFINYGQDVVSLNAENQPTTLIDGVLLQPVFARRSVDTHVQVVDGQTLVFGGLMREDVQELNDKVPLLGDLPLVGRIFRGKAKQSIKKNLVIFVTSRLVRPDGQPQFLTAQERQLIMGGEKR